MLGTDFSSISTRQFNNVNNPRAISQNSPSLDNMMRHSLFTSLASSHRFVNFRTPHQVLYLRNPFLLSHAHQTFKSSHAAETFHKDLTSSMDTKVGSTAPAARDTLDLTFEDAEAAFKSKTTWELIRAYLVFKLCSYKYLVDNNMKVHRKALNRINHRQGNN